jgi:ParB/RepB/Spo0J family partition protein
MIHVSQIRILEGHNARGDVGDVSELAASIEALGLLQALTVVELGAEDGQPVYGLIAGERRLTAARQVGLLEVPCVVQDLDERQRVAAMLVENLQREDLAVLEEARGIRRLADMGLSQREIARQLGRGQSHVSKRLALLALPEEIQAAIDRPRDPRDRDSRGITLAEALELTKLEGHPERQAEAFARGWNVAAAVKGHLQDLERDRAKAAARSRLMSAGVRVLKERDYYSWTSLRERPLLGQGREHEPAAIPLTVEAHKGEPCHAAAIDREGKVAFVCDDPARHPEVDRRTAAQIVKARDEQAEQREDNRRRREASRGRREAIERVLAGANSSNLPFAAAQVTAHWRHEETKVACGLLGLEPVEEHGQYGTHRDYRASLSRYAAGSMAAGARALLALALACGEASVGSTWAGTSELGRRHMEALAAAGYEPNDSDRKHLTGEPGPDEDGDGKGPECRLCGDTVEDGREWVDDPQDLGPLCSGCLDDVHEDDGLPPAPDGGQAESHQLAQQAGAADSDSAGITPGQPDHSTCRICGCTDEVPCEPSGCERVEGPEGIGDLCSMCLPLLQLRPEDRVAAARGQAAVRRWKAEGPLAVQAAVSRQAEIEQPELLLEMPPCG